MTLREDRNGHLLMDGLRALHAVRGLGFDVVIDCELFARISAIFSRLSGAPVRVGFHPHTQEGLYRGGFINRPVLYNPYHHIARQFLTLAEAVDSTDRPPAKRPVQGALPEPPQVLFAQEEREGLRRRLLDEFPALRGRRLVLLYPSGGLLPIRAWPEASYSKLARGLLEAGFAVGIIGLPADREQAGRVVAACGDPACVNLAGWTASVRELLLLFHAADLLVTNDGGPGHFAVLTPIRGLVLFGPETPRLYGPLSERVQAIHLDYSCSPCLTAYNHRDSPCDGDNRCVTDISVRHVLDRALAMLGDESV
jgi:ADP-heptose:LPS heptosyltransferase